MVAAAVWPTARMRSVTPVVGPGFFVNANQGTVLLSHLAKSALNAADGLLLPKLMRKRYDKRLGH